MKFHNYYKNLAKLEEDFSDLDPVDQFPDEIEILKIQYEVNYVILNNYFRAVLLINEISTRAYELTTDVLTISATNYMAWYHRRLCIDKLNLDLEDELSWLDLIIADNQKNYQIWHHRKFIIEKSNNPSHEKEILGNIFDDEPKNFHAWSHRIWVVKRFGLYYGELDYVTKLLKKDCRNNSAWNYRFFLLSYHDQNDSFDFLKELEYVFSFILNDVENESPYNYIRGIVDEPLINKEKLKLKELKTIKITCENIIKNNECYHAYSLLLDFLLEDYADSQNDEELGKKISDMFDKLAVIDFIRKKYWMWRKNAVFNISK